MYNARASIACTFEVGFTLDKNFYYVLSSSLLKTEMQFAQSF